MKHIATLFLSVAAFTAFAADVQKAALNDFDLDANPQVVTNVTFAGLATTNDVAAAIAAIPAPDVGGQIADFAATGTVYGARELVYDTGDHGEGRMSFNSYDDDYLPRFAIFDGTYGTYLLAYLSDIVAATNAVSASLSSRVSLASQAATNYTDAAVAGKLDANGSEYNIRSGTPGLIIDSVFGSSERTYVFSKPGYEGDLNTVARLSDIPESVTPETVTNIVRGCSLGGIWDSELEVWWTPVMVGGSLTYQATTNVNLNAEN